MLTSSANDETGQFSCYKSGRFYLSLTLVVGGIDEFPGPVLGAMHLLGGFGMTVETALGHLGAGIERSRQLLKLRVIGRGGFGRRGAGGPSGQRQTCGQRQGAEKRSACVHNSSPGMTGRQPRPGRPDFKEQ